MGNNKKKVAAIAAVIVSLIGALIIFGVIPAEIGQELIELFGGK